MSDQKMHSYDFEPQAQIEFFKEFISPNFGPIVEETSPKA